MDFNESELTTNGELGASAPYREALKLENLEEKLDAVERQMESPPGKYGKKLSYDPAGPFQKARARTDFCWCVGFILFTVVWFIIIIYGFSSGNVDKWLEPMDSEGRACGKDPGVEKRPYLVRYNDTHNKTCHDCLMCWTSCPKVKFRYLPISQENIKTEEHSTSETEEKKDLDKKEEEKVDESTTKDIGKNSHDEKNSDNKDKNAPSANEAKNSSPEDKDDTKKTNDQTNEQTNDQTNDQTNNDNSGKRNKRAPKNGNKPEDSKDSTKPNPTDPNVNSEKVEDSKSPSVKSDVQPKSSTEDENNMDKKHQEQKVEGNDENDTVEDRKKHMICKPEVQLELVQGFPELDYLVRSKKCAATYEVTHEETADRRCNDAHQHKIEKSRYEVSRTSRDLSNTKFSITGFVFISAILALISIFAMRWFALYFICGSLFIAIAVLFYITYDKIVSDSEDKTLGVLLALFVCFVLIAIIIVVILYLRKEIFKACNMIKESSKAITGLIWTLLFSLIIAFIYGMILMMGVNLYFSLSSIETPIYEVNFKPNDLCICPPELGYTQNSTCDPATFDSHCFEPGKKKCAISRCYLVRYDPHPVGFLHFINYVGLYWSFWFFFGLLDSVLANVFSNWYWTFNKNILTYVTLIEGFWIIGFYHLGSVALGSIIILICEIVRCVLIVICKTLEKINQPFTAIILMQMRWVYDILETFLNYINSRAYVACAMHGTDFLHSARSAYYLMMRNVEKVYRVAEISNWLTFTLALLISAVISKISVAYYQSRKDEVAFAGVPSFFVFVGSLLVTWMMLRVVQVAVETIYQCFLEDFERNDGSCDKPFFASDQLEKILDKNRIRPL